MAKFTVTYGRKFRTAAYETAEITLTEEFDDSQDNERQAYEYLRDLVNAWVEEERDRLIEKEVPRGKNER